MTAFATAKKWLFFGLLALSATLLAACGGPPSHEWLEAPGWKRARLIGYTESAYPVATALDSDGNSYFALAVIEANVPIIQVFSLDPALESRWQIEIPLQRLRRALKPTAIWTQGELQVFWILDDSLFSVRLDAEGNFLEEPRRVSGSRTVSHYDVTVNPQGERMLWFSGERSLPGVFAVDAAGNIQSVDPRGYKPQVIYDAAGALHAAWVQSRAGEVEHHLYYAYYPDGKVSEDQEHLVHTAVVPITSSLYGPELGLDSEHVYLFWSELTRAGLDAGRVESAYLTFSPGGKDVSPERFLPFPNGYNLNYQPVTAILQAGERALPQEQSIRSNVNPTDVYANPLPGGELAIAFRARLPYLRNKNSSQVGLIFLEDEQVTGYQLLSFSPAGSELPSLRADAQGYLYYTWMEQTQSGEFRVYYTSTEPRAQLVLNDLDSEDALQLTGNSLFGMLSGIVLIPFPIFWGLGSVMVYFLSTPFRKENEPITARGTLISIALGLAVYWWAKLFSLPGITSYVPFSAWIPFLPESLFQPLRFGVPIFTGLFAFYIAWRSTYGRENPSLLFFFMIYAGVDGFITIALYGLLFYGAI